MTIGAGKYDDLCTHVRVQAKARGAIVIVIDGDKGQGFAVQADLETILRLPSVLRQLADQLEGDGGKLRS